MTTSAEDNEARKVLIAKLFANYPPEKAAELADKALKDLDSYRELEEGYNPEKEDAKRNLTRRVRDKIRGLAEII
jgi:hypothetical protein